MAHLWTTHVIPVCHSTLAENHSSMSLDQGGTVNLGSEESGNNIALITARSSAEVWTIHIAQLDAKKRAF